MPAKLSQGKVWYIYYYVKEPSSRKLKRFRIKLERFKTKKEKKIAAQIIINRINEQLALGWNPIVEQAAPNSYHTLHDALDSFLSIKGREMEENSMRCYRSYVKFLKKWLSGKGFDEKMYACSFSRQLALEIMDDIDNDEKVSPRTFNNYLMFYRILFNWMVDKGYISGNPFEGIKKKSKKLTQKTRRIMTDDELSRLFTHLQSVNSQYLVICLLCYCCLMRPKEIALLKCGDVDLGQQLIHVRGEIAKNDNDSYRTIPDDMMPYMRELDLSHPDWYIFGSHHEYDFSPGPKQICSRKIAKYWSDHLRHDCGLPMELQFYSLKDTGITNMLGSGVPVSFVKQQADHSSLAMTSIYLGKLQDKASEAIRNANLIK